ncbi:MAG: RNA polymerase sigma factor [Clostridia bacterium]|nr:RNA polymerase sigma factor [Clostridia bacterium]
MTDSEIISLLAARDERGIVALEDKYSLYCQKIAFNILGDREEARECVNDAFLRVWNAAEREKPGKLTAYLGTVTRNIALNRYRDRKNAKNAALSGAISLDDPDEPEYPAEGGTDIDNSITAGALISEFLHEQPEIKQRIFVAKYYYELSDAKISRLLNIPEGSVKSRIHRMKKELRKRLEKGGVDI